jgi:hypothetical protein
LWWPHTLLAHTRAHKIDEHYIMGTQSFYYLFTGIKLMSMTLWELSDLYLFTGIKLLSMKVWELSDL